MFERYTEKAKRSLAYAKYEASQRGNGALRCKHLLLGLIREADDEILELLSASGVDIDELRARVEKLSWRRKRTTTSPIVIAITREAQWVLAHAVEECDSLRHEHVGTVHILLGLLRQEEGVSARALSDFGLELTTMRERVKTLLASKAEWKEKTRTLAALRDLAESLLRVQPLFVFTAAHAQAIADAFATLERSVAPELALVVHRGGVVVASRDRVADALAAWLQGAAWDDKILTAAEGATLVAGPGDRVGVVDWLDGEGFLLVLGADATSEDALLSATREVASRLRQILLPHVQPPRLG